MADKKPEKKGDKKDGKKKDAPEGPSLTGHDYLYWFGGFIVVLLLLSNAVASWKSPLLDSAINPSGQGFPPPGTIVEGTEVASKRDTKVHIEAGGPVIGTQKRGTHGTVLAGPKEFEGAKFYSVHYEDAPDGWVAEADISSHTGIVDIMAFIPRMFFVIQEILIALAFFFGLGIVYVFWKDHKLEFPVETKSAKDKKGTRSEDEAREEMIAAAPAVNEHWVSVMAMAESQNGNDWRQAVIEADIMLDEMLEKMSYHGSSVADKLKLVEPSDFNTLDDAWEAHKVRNRIAHQGKDFVFTQSDARRALGLYEKVFKEFYYI